MSKKKPIKLARQDYQPTKAEQEEQVDEPSQLPCRRGDCCGGFSPHLVPCGV